MRLLLSISIILSLSLSVGAQDVVLDRVLIGSGAINYNGTEFSISSSLGEPVTKTIETTDLIITQGFQQSNYILNEPFILELAFDSASCVGATDGVAYITFISENIEPPYQVSWSTGASSDTITDLTVGSYSVTVTGANGNSVTNTIVVAAADQTDCTPSFYTGITPNGDDFNDYWHVDNAQFFINKTVQIFNRYGSKVWESDDYNNQGGSFIGLHKNGNRLPDGTYFYIAKFDASTYKGWIEISR